MADSQGPATYDEATQTVVMSDGAVADVVTLPQTKDSESAHFEGDRITADLAKSTINAEKARLKTTTQGE